MSAIKVRRLAPTDSLEELTGMLRRAFTPLGRLGFNCACVDQTVDMTRRRLGLGDTFVAVAGNHIVGTITLHFADRDSLVHWYRDPTVASVHQFAVDPSYQGNQIGRMLLQTAETWARSRGHRELALDTPERAGHLRAYYRHRGFRLVEAVQFEDKSYGSVVLSKEIHQPEAKSESNRNKWAAIASLSVSSSVLRGKLASFALRWPTVAKGSPKGAPKGSRSASSGSHG